MRSSLRARSVPACDDHSYPCRASLHGGLDQIGLATLLTILDMERRSGVLLLHRAGEIGRLWLCDGRVIRARMEHTRLTGRAAVFDLFGWEDGRFEFTQSEVEDNDEIAMPTTHLLMEAARRMDEAGAALTC
jgi:two-component system OmpR family response regulator